MFMFNECIRPDHKEKMLQVYRYCKDVSVQDMPNPAPELEGNPDIRDYMATCVKLMVANGIQRGFLHPYRLSQYIDDVRWIFQSRVAFTEPQLRLFIQGVVYLEQDVDLIHWGNEHIVNRLYSQYSQCFPEHEAAMCDWILRHRFLARQPFGTVLNNYQESMRKYEYGMNVFNVNAQVRLNIEQHHKSCIQRNKQIRQNAKSCKYLPSAIQKGDVGAVRAHSARVFCTSNRWLKEVYLLAVKSRYPEITQLVSEMIKRIKGVRES